MKTTHTCLAVLSVFLFARDAVADFWTDPVVVSGVNTGLDEGAPFPTYDGHSLYFSRQQKNPSGVPIGHLFGATGPSSSGQFTSVQELSVNDTSNPFTATSVIYGWVSEDSLRLYYSESSSSTRSIKMTERTSPGDLGAWAAGSSVGGFSGLNVANPSLTPDEKTLVFAGNNLGGGQGDWDIWMGTRGTDGSFGGFRNLSLVNSGSQDLHPRLSADGLTLYFASNRNGDFQLFQATWLDSDSLFGPPEPLLLTDESPVRGQYPAISADGHDLYFAKWADDTQSYDIFVSHAIPVPGAAVLGLLGLSCAGWWCRRRAT